ncbi:uncharacterized protein [Hetaerina americana]|uniref:uncharacterized protein isoform X2 n=1 Tax=Hetaerina americana TaxID=62018 RepID=UPI003A7F1650
MKKFNVLLVHKQSSLILRPDGSFSWFGPRTGDILELNKFCAYKIVGKTRSNSTSVCGTNVSHPSVSILFESGNESIHNQPLCCEVTVNFRNTMVLQFPGQCLMHFNRLSRDYRNDSAQAANYAGKFELGSYSLPFKEKTRYFEDESYAQNGANIPCEIKCKASISSAKSPGQCHTVAEDGSGANSSGCHSDLYHDPVENLPRYSSSVNAEDSSCCDSIRNATAMEMPSFPSQAQGSSVQNSPSSSLYHADSPSTSTLKKSGKEGLSQCVDVSDHSISDTLPCPSSQLPTPPAPPPTSYPCAASYVTHQPPHLIPSSILSSQFECLPILSHDMCDGTSQPEARRNTFHSFGSLTDKSHDLMKDLDKIMSSVEDAETPSTSPTSSTSSMAMSSSHKCQDSSFSLLRALQEGYFSDLVVVAENGVKFEVHSTILGLSFPNIDWAASAEEEEPKSLSNNGENKSDSPVSPSMNDLPTEAVSNPCKCPDNREVSKKTKQTLLNTQNCHHLERKCPKIQNSMVTSVEQSLGLADSGQEKDKGWKEGMSSQKRFPSENSFSSSKAHSKQKDDVLKVKLPLLPEDVVGALLHYAYSESLPPSLSPETAEKCIKFLSPPSTLAMDTIAFRNMCTSYLRNNALRQDIVTLTAGIHGCLSKMEEHLTMGDYMGMASSEEDEEEDDIGRRAVRSMAHRRRDRGLPHPTPTRLCSALKQAAREASLALVLALELCQIYAKNQCHLGKMEICEVAQFAASRLAPLASQLDAVLSAILRSIPPAISPVIAGARRSPPLNDNQRRNGDGTTLRDRLASHLVPEMESALEVLSTLTMCLKEDIEEILGAIKTKESSKEERKTSPSSTSDNDDTHIQLDDEEMLNCIHQRIAFYLFHLMQKKESFSDLGNGGRLRVICQTLEELSEELPIFLLRLRDTLATIDEQLAPEHLSPALAEWTSKVSSLLSLLSTHRSILQPLLLMISELVQREAFLVSLQRLKLLNCTSEDDEGSRADSPTKTPPHGSSFRAECDASSYKLSLVGSLITPPPARRSHLSRRALKLLRTGHKADMVFQVALTSISSSDFNNPPVTDNRLGFVEWDEDSDALNGGRWVWRIGAHRAIVAARCDWFRRALLSGMKEAIKRQIVVHDTTPQQLLLFLQWIYGGQLQIEWNVYQDGSLVQDGRKDYGQYPHGVLGAEQLWSLLVLADQLEADDLKNACEHMLLSGGCHLADPEATLACLSLADQVNARAMRNACLQHIFCNPRDVVESELFEELPSSLQSEVYDRLIWSRPRKSQTTEWLLSTPEEDDDEPDGERRRGLGFSNPLHEQFMRGDAAIGNEHRAIGENPRGRDNANRE